MSRTPALVLEIFRGDQLLFRSPLSERGVTIGRSDESDIALPDRQLSARHVRVELHGDGAQIADLGSTHGTHLRGAPVDSATLAPGDAFTIGGYLVRLTRAGAPAPRASDASRDRAEPALDALIGVTDLQAVLALVLAQLMELTAAEKGCMILAAGGALEPLVAEQVGALADPTFSRTLCERAVVEGRPVLLLGDADWERAGAPASLAVQRPGMVVAAPLAAGDDVLGVAYLESRRPPARVVVRPESLAEPCAAGGRALRAALDRRELVRERERWRWVARAADEGPDLLRCAKSKPMREVTRIVRRIADEDVTALILGESGTGKEVAAHTIHRLSPRRDGPFVALNCGAIPKDLVEAELFGYEKGAFTGAAARTPGRFELAQGGTLFLDEVAELPRDAQVKLLRVLETRTVERLGSREPIRWDARVLTATNQDLEAAVARGEFRQDLYYRINVVSFTLPPLRDRVEDLPDLTRDLLQLVNRRFRRKLAGVTAAALDALTAYRWPGNIRELRNVIERAFILESGDQLTPASLPFAPAKVAANEPAAVASLADYLLAHERAYVKRVLDGVQGNVARAATLLGMGRGALYRRLNQLGLRGAASDDPE